jgi:hypothetical protein
MDERIATGEQRIQRGIAHIGLPVFEFVVAESGWVDIDADYLRDVRVGA